jgi:hypothetical protein
MPCFTRHTTLTRYNGLRGHWLKSTLPHIIIRSKEHAGLLAYLVPDWQRSKEQKTLVTKVKEKSHIINAAEGIERPYDERQGVAGMDTTGCPPSDDAERTE